MKNDDYLGQIDDDHRTINGPSARNNIHQRSIQTGKELPFKTSDERIKTNPRVCFIVPDLISGRINNGESNATLCFIAENTVCENGCRPRR